MTNEKQSYIENIVAMNKNLVTKTFDKTQEIVEQAVNYNRDVWSAGFDVFADARTEGKQAFDKLITRSEELEAKVREMLEQQTATAKGKLTEAFNKVSETVTNVTDSVTDTAAKVSLEDLLDTRVAKTMKDLGTPAVNAGNTIIDKLTDIATKLKEIAAKSPKVAELNVAEVAASNKPVAKKPAVKKPAAKKPAAKKPAAKKSAATPPAAKKEVA